jgi:hypothetical protein
MLLHGTNHRRGSTHQYLDILGRLWTMFFDHILSHKTNTPRPSLGRRIIEHQKQLESILLVPRKLLKLLSQKYILLIDIGKDEVYLCSVRAVFEDCADDLEHGSDSCAPCNHTECANETGAVDHLTFGAFDFDGVANFQLADDFGDVACRIALQSH